MIHFLKIASVLCLSLSYIFIHSSNVVADDLSCGYMEDDGKLDLANSSLSLKERFKRDSLDEKILNKNFSRPTCKVSVDRLSQINNVIYVDVREPEEFERANIPGSINLNFHLVESRNFLKNQPAVLVDNGFHYAELFQYCDSFIKKGFKEVYVLEGGFPAWLDRQKKSNDTSSLSYIFPRDFDSLKRKSNWLVFDFSKDISDVSGRYYQFSLQNDKDLITKKIRAIVERFSSETGRPPNVLLVDADGSKISYIASMFPGRSLSYVYAFKGGLVEYDDYTKMNHKILVGKAISDRKRNIGCNR